MKIEGCWHLRRSNYINARLGIGKKSYQAILSGKNYFRSLPEQWPNKSVKLNGITKTLLDINKYCLSA